MQRGQALQVFDTSPFNLKSSLKSPTMLSQLSKSIKMFKSVHADDAVDPKPEIEAECGDHHCASLKSLLDQCTKRVHANPASGETCTQELFDFLHCVDHCVKKNTFLSLALFFF